MGFYTGTETLPVSQLGDLLEADAGPITTTTAETKFFVGNTSATGTSTSIEGLVDDVRVYDTALTPEELEVVRMEGITGDDFLDTDFNEDGLVNGDDFLAWQSGFNQFPGGDATKADGDANGDGFVNGDDFLLWQADFPSPGEGSGSGAVPEPSTLAMVGLSSLLLVARRRRNLG